MGTAKTAKKAKAKSVFLSKVRTDQESLTRWDTGYRAHKKRTGHKDYPFAAWIRLALDAQAARDLQGARETPFD